MRIVGAELGGDVRRDGGRDTGDHPAIQGHTARIEIQRQQGTWRLLFKSGLYWRCGVDEDLETMSHAQLVAEVKKLRAGIRTHRDSSGQELCWHHPALWSLLPERTDPVPTVPTWPEFLRGCLRYRQSLDEQLPDAPRSDAPYPGAQR